MAGLEWNAILDGSLSDRTGETIQGITADLARFEPGNSVADKSDLAVYFAYLARAGRDPMYEERASAWLDASIDEAATQTRSPALFGGVAGVAWAIEHIGQLLRDTTESGQTADSAESDMDPNEDVDAVLMDIVRQRPWQQSYDLVGGLVGIGIYFLERLPRVRAREGLEEIVERLSELAEHDDLGVRWHTPAGQLPAWQQKLAPHGYYNLGMAHGIPGIVALLGHCISRRIATASTERLLAGAMAWLLGQQRPASDDSCFSAWISPGVAEKSGSRLAWCYGDLGVAVAILSAGLAVGESGWTRAGLDVAIACIERPRSSGGINDAGLCHGSAGLAHIFNRLFHTTGDERFRDAAREWFAHALELRTNQGYGGYQRYYPMGIDGAPIDPPWRDDASLLSGSVGIGLALLAGSTALSPDWDRLLMTALPATSIVTSAR